LKSEHKNLGKLCWALDFDLVLDLSVSIYF